MGFKRPRHWQIQCTRPRTPMRSQNRCTAAKKLFNPPVLRQAFKNYVMKTLKIVIMMILFSMFITSCTELGIEDEFIKKDTIENTKGTDGNNNGTGGGGKGPG